MRQAPAPEERLHLGHHERGQHEWGGDGLELCEELFQCACSVFQSTVSSGRWRSYPPPT